MKQFCWQFLSLWNWDLGALCVPIKWVKEHINMYIR